MRAKDLELRVIRWFSDERNTILLLYFLSVFLGLASIALFFSGSDSRAGRVELGLLLASGAIIFYVVISSLANQPN